MSYNNKFYLGDYVREIEIVDLMDEKSDDNNKAWINSVNIIGETPLHIAARRRILDLFERMLPHCNDVEACDDQGNTILHQLVDSGIESDEEHKRKRLDLLRLVIARGGARAIDRRNKLGATPVHLAAKHCHLAMLTILREAGADFNVCTDDGETPLLLACKHMFKFRGTADEADIVDFLMSDECDVNAVDCEGYSALHYAVEWCSGRTIGRLLEAGADVRCRTKEHKLAPMHLAARRKNPTKMDILMKAGATARCEETDELTPLHLALLESTTDIVERLINYGCDLDRPDAILQFTPLHVAVYQQRRDCVQLLVNEGADVDVSGGDGLTCLHLAAVLGDADFVKILVDHNADVNRRDKNDLTPLHLAIRRNYGANGLEGEDSITYGKKNSLVGKLLTREYCPTNRDYAAVVLLLIDSGSDVDVVTEYGENLMYMAVEANNVDLLEMLLKIGVSVESTEDAKSFLHLALESNSTDVLKLLVKNGVKLNCKGKSCLYTLLYFIAEGGEDMDEFEKTPLLRAIDHLENVEIKKSVLHLCALVNANNESTCKNFHIIRHFPYNFKCLLMIGLYINDFDVFCKLVFDTCLKRASSDNAKNGLFRFIEELRSQGNECRQEDDNLKKYSIKDNVTLYDLLHLEFKRRRIYLDSLNLCEIESKFPISYELILARVREAAVRKVLLEVTQVSLCRLTNVELPIFCVEEVFANLEIINMIAVIEAAELDH